MNIHVGYIKFFLTFIIFRSRNLIYHQILHALFKIYVKLHYFCRFKNDDLRLAIHTYKIYVQN